MIVLSRRNLVNILGSITNLVKMWPICLAAQLHISIIEALCRRSLSRTCGTVRAQRAACLFIFGNFTRTYVLNEAAVAACVVTYDLLVLCLLKRQIWRGHFVSFVH